jgi:hypothetical protein
MGGYGGYYGGGTGAGGNVQWGGIGLLVITYSIAQKRTDIAGMAW